MTPDAWVEGHARFAPHAPALEFQGRVLGYAELADRIARTAGALAGLGVGAGDRVAYLGFNRPEAVELQLACARLGAIYAPLNWRLADAELEFIIADAGPKVIFADTAHAEVLARLATDRAVIRAGLDAPGPSGPALGPLRAAAAPMPPRPQAPDAPLQLFYTSGTTGRPKGAVLTHAAVAATARMGRHMTEMTAHDRVLTVLPLFHVGGMNILGLTALSAGAALVLHERVDPQAILAAFAEGGITLTTMVPTIMEALLADGGWPEAARASLRAIAIGSTDVPAALTERVGAAGVPLLQVYGCTESGPTAIYQTAAILPETIGAMGRAGLLCEARAVRADGTPCAPGEVGEIELRGPNVMTGYWNNPQATAEALRPDGWLRTGDAGRVEPDGTWWFADRIKHVIISGGENIYPAELARVLAGHPLLREFAVVGVPDARWGAVPVVLAVRGMAEVDEAAVLAAFEGRIARYKRPRAVLFVKALPRNAMGKVVLDEAAAMAAAAMAARDG